jgi:hypothetical protein
MSNRAIRAQGANTRRVLNTIAVVLTCRHDTPTQIAPQDQSTGIGRH